MATIQDIIKTKRPSLSTNSINTYSSILKNLYKKIFSNEDTFTAELFDKQYDKVLRFLEDIPANKRKTALSALVVICPDIKHYRDLMMTDIQTYNTEISKQEKTPTQQANWVETNEISSLWEKMKKDVDLLYKKLIWNENDRQSIQNFVLLTVCSGLFFPVRRSKDWCDFKIRNIDMQKDNYLEKSNLVFNSYKTAKTYGKQTVTIPTKCKNILHKWIKMNPNVNYLFTDTNFQPLTAVKINQRLNKLFGGKKISVNALRHSFLTTKYANTMKEMKDMENTMKEMGSSTNVAQNYVKLD
jgi:integrase